MGKRPTGERRARHTSAASKSTRRPTEPPLAADIGTKLVTVSIELIEKLYVHLPLKRSMYAVNPLQRLRLLLRRLSAANARPVTVREFYNEMLSIFSQLRDLHTTFVLPEPFRSTTAYLPFRLEACIENGQRTYVVAEVKETSNDAEFVRGVEVTHWNGVKIERAVAANAERESGSNAAARHAQGLASMTMRWLGQSLPPDEEWVDVRYVPQSGDRSAPRGTRFQWHVFQQKTVGEHEVARAQGSERFFLGMDARGEVERQVRGILFGRHRRQGPASRVSGRGEGVESTAPDVFPSCRNVKNDIGQKYQGPVVLVTDALCYSTTDIFAAGFQDHRIGEILGVDDATGAGGANVWEYSLISDLLGDSVQFPRALPGAASFRLAVRRVTRVRENAGLPLEDLGVRPTELHELTRNDVLKRSVDLIAHAAKLLRKMPKQHLSAVADGKLTFRVACTNIDRVDAYIDGRPLSSKPARRKTFALTVPMASRFRGAAELRLQGFRKGELAAATRVALQ